MRGWAKTVTKATAMSEATIHLVRDESQTGDLGQRARALDLSQTFIVRAPAGSGKTDLLTRRFLKSLAVVNEPEEILAITFTRAATAEMRARVLKHLEDAARFPESTPNEDERVTLARAALRNSDARGWRILEQPQRLNIETIDSLCLRIAHGQPLLSRMGGRLNPVERADLLYAQAARHTLGRLGGADAALSEAIAHLLALRDNSLQDCERLIAEMLKNRDQWVRAFPLVEAIDWDEVRLELERPFKAQVRRGIEEVYRRIAPEPLLVDELVELADYAAGNCDKFGLLARMGSLPDLEMLEHWQCVAEFLLTQSGTWRKSLTVRDGFPPSGLHAKEQKRRMEGLLVRLQEIAGLREALVALKDLPLPRYDDDQWTTLRHLFMTLRRAVAELNVMFAERNVVDFPQLNISARQVLRDAEEDPDVLLALSGGLRHLLVDEFQDTSRSQFELIRLLVRAWDEGDGRTCFFVGDPMQSIYMFRQAEVELFAHVERNGIAGEATAIGCELVQLSTNFRSHAGLTEGWNEMFAAIFGNDAPVPFSPSFAAEPALFPDAVKVYPQVIGAADRAKATPEEKNDAQEREARQVLGIIERHGPRIEQAKEDGKEYRVAVLVRARQHLAKIVPLLRQRGIPFRAVEIETLAERQELLDLLSLTRALLHPMDRIAWLAMLRAPWCGLTVRDLHTLTGADDRAMRRRPMLELIEERLGLLDSEAAERAALTVGILKQALATRFAGLHAGSFSQWIERTWRSLGGPLCVDAAAYENVQTFFAMLDEIAPDGMACMTAEFDAQLEWLFAQPDPRVSEGAGVQLMTIHKAKGLGFDVVIVPGLDRKAAADPSSLIVSLERTGEAGLDEMVVAPIGAKGGDAHPTYKWVQRQRTGRQDEEIKRLLYVACTRARRELHLLGTATLTQSGLNQGDKKSLLDVGWPAFEAKFLGALKDKAQAKVLDFPLELTHQGELFELAATAEERGPRLTVKRLPLETDFRPRGKNVTASGTKLVEGAAELVRPEGSRRTRVVGNAVHALLDQLSRGLDPGQIEARARGMLRAAAFAGRTLEEALSEVVGAVESCRSDTAGRWILEQHAGGQSESSWSQWIGEEMVTLRADRVFRGGAAPGEAGDEHLWIIDYKMSAPAGEALEEFIAEQRNYYAPQLERYADALKQIEGEALPVRMGLYYPRIAKLDWWED